MKTSDTTTVSRSRLRSTTVDPAERPTGDAAEHVGETATPAGVRAG